MSDNRPDPRIVPLPETCHLLLGVFSASQEAADEWEAPPDALLRRFGATEQQLAELAARRHVRVLPATASPDEAAGTALGLRTQALTLAAACDGIVVDFAIPRIVATELPDLTDASQWVAFGLTEDGGVESVGLAGFGLPEMRWPAPVESTGAVLAVLSGLAHRLIAEWPANDPVGPATITLADVAAGMGAGAAPSDQVLDIEIGYADGYLLVSSNSDPASLFE